MTDVRVDNPADFPPQEDTVERLWTPQRMTYVLRNSEIAQPSPRRRNARSAPDPRNPTKTASSPGVARTCSPS